MPRPVRIGMALMAILCILPARAEAARRPHGKDETGRQKTAAASPEEPGYKLTPGPQDSWNGINHAQQLRVRVNAQGIRVLPLTGGRPMWEWGLSMTHQGNPGDLREADGSWPVPSGRRVDLLRGPLTEWFVNSPEGLKHGVEISSLEEPALTFLEFALTGTLAVKIAEDRKSIRFTDRTGATVLTYRDLRAVDSEGRDVPVRWENAGASGGLRLAMEGQEHRYPLTVTGLLVTPKGSARRSRHLKSEGALPAALAIPTNDLCAGAELIPGDGPFPYLSAVYDVTLATTVDDPPEPSCQTNFSRSIWFEFTPAVTAPYTISLCADAPTASTLEDSVLAVYSATGDCAGFTEVADACDDDSCTATDLQSVISNLDLGAGVTYYIVVWAYSQTAPLPGAGDVQLRITEEAPPPAAPPNDKCIGAEVIPDAGPFPYTSSVTANIAGAKTTGDPPLPSCQANVTRSVWYSFTPATSGRYSFSLCSDAPTGTTVDDTVMAIYTGSRSCGGYTQVAGACDDDSCVFEGKQSVVDDIALTAGTTYYLVVWKYGVDPPATGDTSLQLRVSEVAPPVNDTCAMAPEVFLDLPASGTTAYSVDDYELGSGSACFPGIGQTISSAAGGEVAYRFTAPGSADYSFRVNGYPATRNAVLYAASDCPAGPPPSEITGCLSAANRNSGFPGEEVPCLNLSPGQSVYLYVDEHSLTPGAPFTIEVNECLPETEPNDTPALACDLACGIEGSISPGDDADFYLLGAPDPGSRVFAMVDGAASSSTDYDLRVTTDADTLEYDDLNNATEFGGVAPNTAGTPLTGEISYLRVSHYSAAATAEPYRLYGIVQPPEGNATPEIEPNDNVATATFGSNQYYAGALADTGDVDTYALTASAGDLIIIGLDLDPARNETPFNGALSLLDSSASTMLLVNDAGVVSSTAPGSGDLTATTPFSPGEAIAYRIRMTGTYYVKVTWSSGTPGDYLLSISHNCRISPPTDLEVTQADTPDPVTEGGEVTYTVTVSNLGSEPASVVRLLDDLPVGATLVSALPSQGTCSGTGPVECHLGTISGGSASTVVVVVTAPSVPGSVVNAVWVSTMVTDIDPLNDLSTESTDVGAPPDSDGDGVPDPADCAPSDPNTWAIPGEAVDLLFPDGSDTTLLQWDPPAQPGGNFVTYDLLRSPDPGDFSAPFCILKNMAATTATDIESPAGTFAYIVRTRNGCGSNAGTGPGGAPRLPGACP